MDRLPQKGPILQEVCGILDRLQQKGPILMEACKILDRLPHLSAGSGRNGSRKAGVAE